MPGVTSIATSLIVRVAVARIVRIVQFVRDEVSDVDAMGIVDSGMLTESEMDNGTISGST